MSKQQNTGDFLSVTRELEEMAREVPEMPESFRAGWREKIREEGTEGTASPAGPQPSPSSGRVRAFRRWMPWASAAAVLVFLIAGTLATRGMLSPRLKRQSAVPAMVQNAASEEDRAGSPEGAPVSSAAGVPATSASEKALSETFTEGRDIVANQAPAACEEAVSCEEGAAYEDSAAYEEAAAYEEEAASYDEGAAYEDSAAYEEEAAYEEGAACEEAAEYTRTPASEGTARTDGALFGQAVGNTVFFSGSRSSAPEEATALPTLTAAPEATEAAPGETASASGSESGPGSSRPGLFQEAGYFLEDMGAFLLAALPWLLGAGVLCGGIFLVVRRFRR